MMKTEKIPTEIAELRLRARTVIRELKKLFPHTKMFLNYENNWELLVAVQLSAQCTDKKVNEITLKLFKKYPTFDDYVNASTKQFEQDIFQSGYFRSKTKNILSAAQMVKHVFHGEIPKTMEEILTLPGVARKTANVVLGNAYGVVEGIAVDTHVKRLVRVFGITEVADPVRIEKILMEIIPKKDWLQTTYLFIEYGRAYCPAKKHDMARCPLGHYKW